MRRGVIISNFWREALQFFVVCLITILLAEIALRVYNYYNPLFIFYTDSYNRYRGKPFSQDYNFKLNSMGFKDVEVQKKSANEFRILGIGDSFAYGVVPYEHNYLTLLEDRFKDSATNVNVINMGIPSIGPVDYYSLLIREGLELSPDMVLISLFVGNDLTPTRRELLSYSYVASMIYYLYTTFLNYEGVIIHKDVDYCDDCPNFTPEAYLRIEFDRSKIYLSANQQKTKEWISNKMLHIDKIRRVCEENGIDLRVVIIPDELQISDELKRLLFDKYYPDVEPTQWDETQPNQILRSEFESRGIHYLDLYPVFKAKTLSQALYRPRDSHWNIAGNRLAAETIHQYLLADVAIGKP